MDMAGRAQRASREYRGIRMNGSTFDIEVNSGLIRSLEGRPIRMVFIVRDVTERRRAEAERADLEARNRHLQKAESLGRMAGAIAHHFNNQLQAVLGNLELAGNLAPGTDGTPWLTQARRATERAAGVSRMMLAYLGKTALSREPLPLYGLCARSLPILRTTLPARVDLEIEGPQPGPVILADGHQVHEVLSCLVNNAWEAMEGGGRIAVAVRVLPAADIPVPHR